MGRGTLEKGFLERFGCTRIFRCTSMRLCVRRVSPLQFPSVPFLLISSTHIIGQTGEQKRAQACTSGPTIHNFRGKSASQTLSRVMSSYFNTLRAERTTLLRTGFFVPITLNRLGAFWLWYRHFPCIIWFQNYSSKAVSLCFLSTLLRFFPIERCVVTSHASHSSLSHLYIFLHFLQHVFHKSSYELPV